MILGSPQILRPIWLVVSWPVPGPYNNNSRIPEIEKRVDRIHGPLEYIGYMVHWKRDDGKRSEFTETMDVALPLGFSSKKGRGVWGRRGAALGLIGGLVDLFLSPKQSSHAGKTHFFTKLQVF